MSGGVMEGLYLYGIREKAGENLSIPSKGIDGQGEVFALPCGELEAIVSAVSLREFASEEIQKRAGEDLAWIKEKAVTHEKIIEEVMKLDKQFINLIPIRFGTVFKEQVGLEKTLKKEYFKLKEILDRNRGKLEWSVKVYLKERRKIEQIIEDRNEVIKAKKKEIASLPEGMAFFREEELRDEIVREFDKELNEIVEFIFANFKKHAVRSVNNKILAKEISGKREAMILNAAYLLPEEKTDGFKKEIETLNREMETKGLYLEYSGPWPVYNFSGEVL